jgi:8-oxo-dGTP pyrophosphatase MutT (NUDIX family)
VKRLVTTGTAADEIGVSLTTLQRWAHAGLVEPASRTAGGHFRWDIADLKRQLDRHEQREQPIVAVVVTSDRGVLIGRRNDGVPPWTLIAGEIEPGEDPADTARREVKEETGLLIEPGEILGRRVHPATSRVMIYMTGRPVHGLDIHVGDEAELAEVRWVSLAEADDLLPGLFGPVRSYLTKTIGA